MDNCARYQLYAFLMFCVVAPILVAIVMKGSTPLPSSRFFKDWQDAITALRVAQSAEEKELVWRLLKAQTLRTGGWGVVFVFVTGGLSFIGSMCSDTLEKIRAVGAILRRLLETWNASPQPHKK